MQHKIDVTTSLERLFFFVALLSMDKYIKLFLMIKHLFPHWAFLRSLFIFLSSLWEKLCTMWTLQADAYCCLLMGNIIGLHCEKCRLRPVHARGLHKSDQMVQSHLFLDLHQFDGFRPFSFPVFERCHQVDFLLFSFLKLDGLSRLQPTIKPWRAIFGFWALSWIHVVRCFNEKDGYMVNRQSS